jgi:hypothetical protein
MSSDYRADVFYSLNPLRPDSPLTASRTLNRAVNSSQAADHGDILGRHNMFVDFDPVRESNTASTPIQKAESLVVAGRVQDYLKSFGFPAPVLTDSGNGNHLVSRLDGAPIASGVIRSILKHLQSQFGSDVIDIDLGVANLARVARLPGTINRKGGACSPASVLSYPDTFTPVPRETLLRVARLGGYSTQQEALDAPEEGETPSVDDMLELICRDYPHELALDTASHEDGSDYFYLSHCPFVGRRHEGSNRKSTFIVIRPTGKVGFQCYAGKCASKGFGALLRLLWRRTGKRPSVPVLTALLDAAS